MTSHARALALALASALSLACVQEPTVPKVGQDPVSISLTVSSQSLKIGQPDTFKVVVRNNLASGVRLFFRTQCQVLFTVRALDGSVVTPRQGRPECIAATSQLGLAPGASQTFTTVWRGGFRFAPNDSTGERVPSGAYFASATLDAIGYTVVAPAFKISLTQ